jgi:hypothetical protein
VSTGAPDEASQGPTLAVLITYHDERELLTECLLSFLGAPSPPDRVLVFDDASRYPAESFVPVGLGVEVVRSEHNVGPAAGRNRLLALVDTDYIHFHDADDRAQPAWGTLVRGALVTRPDAVYTDVASVDETGRQVSPRVLRLEPDDAASSAEWVQTCLDGIMITSAGTHCRRRLLEAGGYDVGLWGREDWDLTLRLALAPGYRPIIVPQAAIVRRNRATSLSQRAALQAEHGLRALEKAAGYVPPEYRPLLADVVLRTGLQLHAEGRSALALRAFELARRLGPAPLRFFAQQRKRLLLRLLGPERFATLSSAYRAAVPEKLRRRLRRQ